MSELQLGRSAMLCRSPIFAEVQDLAPVAADVSLPKSIEAIT